MAFNMTMLNAIAAIFSCIVVFVVMLMGKIPAIHGGGVDPTSTQIVAANMYPKQNKTSFNDFCYPSAFKLQPPQKFVAEWMAPETNNMTMLCFHKIGAGKSCTIIQVCEKWISRGKPLVVMPASLIANFRNEMRGPCGNNAYVSKRESTEAQTLTAGAKRYREIVSASDEKIDENYDLLSYNKFVTQGKHLEPPILVIDEVHNVLNTSGTYYRELLRFIHNRPKMRVLLLSATPIYDNCSTLPALLNMLRITVANDSIQELRTKLDGHVSYYEGAPSFTFPKTQIVYDICKMSRFQSRWYQAEVEAEIKKSGRVNLHQVDNSFYSKSRARSNVVFPRGLAGTYGLPVLTKAKILESLDVYSIKLFKLMKRLKKGDLSFVYTNYASFGGIRTLYKCLTANGFFDYFKHGPGSRRFCLWTGDTTNAERQSVLKTYNDATNLDGSMLQIVVGSPAAKEGFSLLNTKFVHIMESYWNWSRLEQVLGRCSRFCSHKALPKNERSLTVYIYCAVSDRSGLTKNNYTRRKVTPFESIDLYLLNIADEKRKTIDSTLDMLKHVAVDAFV